VQRQSPQQIVDRILELPEGTRFSVLAPIVRDGRANTRALLDDLARQGFTRARVDGTTIDLSERADVKLARPKTTPRGSFDRLIVRENIKRRLTDSLETALRPRRRRHRDPSDDQRRPTTKGEALTFSQHLACPKCGTSYEELAPRNFSFTRRTGACATCSGLGTKFEVDPISSCPILCCRSAKVRSIRGRANRAKYFQRLLEAVAENYDFSPDTPWEKLKKAQHKILLYGAGASSIKVTIKNRHGRERTYNTHYEGIIPFLQRRHTDSDSDWIREQIEGYMREVPCGDCGGARLKPATLAVTIGGTNIANRLQLSIGEAAKYLSGVELTEREKMSAERVVKEIKRPVGSSCSTSAATTSRWNDRPATLAGGEAQRILLASQIGSGLVGVLYVLDEPSIGLHQRDNHRLIETLIRLRDLGNTVIVVEHDEDTIAIADHIVDIGPGAGDARRPCRLCQAVSPT